MRSMTRPPPSWPTSPQYAPPPAVNGWGREVEHRLTVVEIHAEHHKERATKHGMEIDEVRAELSKIKTYGLRLFTYALIIGTSALAHLTKDPVLTALAGLLKNLKGALP